MGTSELAFLAVSAAPAPDGVVLVLWAGAGVMTRWAGVASLHPLLMRGLKCFSFLLYCVPPVRRWFLPPL